jgi:hypothetical protein
MRAAARPSFMPHAQWTSSSMPVHGRGGLLRSSRIAALRANTDLPPPRHRLHPARTRPGTQAAARPARKNSTPPAGSLRAPATPAFRCCPEPIPALR